MASEPAASTSTAPEPHTAALAGAKPEQATPTPTPKIKKEWYQNDSRVFVTFFTRNLIADLSKATVKVDLEPRSASLTVTIPGQPDGLYDLDPLARTIDVEASSYKVGRVKVDLELAKAKPGIKWKELEGTDEEASDVKIATVQSSTASSTAHGYPSSSRKKTNWDAVAADAVKEEESRTNSDDPNAGGDKAVNELFQKLYAGATDEQRRAMIKSYQLSGGTSLSTNWAEVEKGVGTQIQPPDGMEAKRW